MSKKSNELDASAVSAASFQVIRKIASDHPENLSEMTRAMMSAQAEYMHNSYLLLSSYLPDLYIIIIGDIKRGGRSIFTNDRRKVDREVVSQLKNTPLDPTKPSTVGRMYNSGEFIEITRGSASNLHMRYSQLKEFPERVDASDMYKKLKGER